MTPVGACESAIVAEELGSDRLDQQQARHVTHAAVDAFTGVTSTDGAGASNMCGLSSPVTK